MDSDAEDWAHEHRAAESYSRAVDKKPIVKTVLAALMLFTVGSVMLYFGVNLLGKEQDRALGMIVVGTIAFLPGSYAVFNLYGAWRGWAGYSFEQLPSYDD